jgi:ABC-type polysaccharide/polyol phosphate transport system ATPase subunit
MVHVMSALTAELMAKPLDQFKDTIASKPGVTILHHCMDLIKSTEDHWILSKSGEIKLTQSLEKIQKQIAEGALVGTLKSVKSSQPVQN